MRLRASKGLMLTAMILSGAVCADTQVLLKPPSSLVGVGRAAHPTCVGKKFDADGSIHGACRTQTTSPCSGRGCRPVVHITTTLVSWDAAGNPTSSIGCSIVRHHPPQTDRITYLAGHRAVDCPEVSFDRSGATVPLS